MAAKKPVKPKTTASAGAEPPMVRRATPAAPAATPKPATQSVQLPPVVLRPTKVQPSTPWLGLFGRKAADGALRENLSAVKSGVLHEFESMSQQKGTPLTASPFRNVVLPPRTTHRYGAKFLVILLFLGLFGAIMMLAGQLADPNRLPKMEAKTQSLATVEPAAGPTPEEAKVNAPAQPTPVSRQDIQHEPPAAQAIPQAPTVLASHKTLQGANAIALTLTLGNTSETPLPAGPLNLTIADAAGRTLKTTTLVLEAPLNPRESRQQTWTLPLDSKNKLDGFVATVPLQALTVKITPGS